MAKFHPQVARLLLGICLLTVCAPHTTAFKILSKSSALLPDLPTTGCPIVRLGSQFNALLDAACGILGGVFFNLNLPLLTHGEQIRPEPGFYFQEPDTTANPPDQRGPCPALNLLANYGYLPRNGIVTLGQIVEATARGFNMGVDIATVLAALAVVSTGNIATLTFSIGGPDPRVGIGNIGGLSRHNTVECDISANREDFYLANCDNHDLSSRLFKQNVQFAKDQGGLFNLEAMTNQFIKNADYSKQYNPYLLYSPGSLIVSTAAHIFYAYFFANGTYKSGGTPDYTSISNIVGANVTGNAEDYQFEYIPERWPEIGNAAGKPWYRRSFPFTLVELIPLILAMYLRNPVGIPFGQLGTSHLTLQTIICTIYQTINQIVPTFAAQGVKDIADALTGVLSTLDVAFTATTLGCPQNSISSNGGSSPKSQTCSSQNNQYYQTYFSAAPK